MPFSKIFFINISLLVTMSYLTNLLYKYGASRFRWFGLMSSRIRNVLLSALLVGAGWITIAFGLQIGGSIIFDMRLVPLIVSIFVFRHPAMPLFVGVGIGLVRLSFGWNHAALAGCLNLALLGIAAAGLHVGFSRSKAGYPANMLVSLAVINMLNAVNLALFGAMSSWAYLTTVMPYTLPLGTGLSALFLFMLRDFYLERRRTMELQATNALLLEQKSELERAKAVLEEQARELKESSRYKSEFLANMSHELRTPLNSIITLSQLTADGHEGRFTEEELQFLGIIRSSGEALLGQINDILDLSKLDAGRLEVYEEEVSVHEVAQILEHTFGWAAGQKRLAFSVAVAGDVPEIIRTDAARVHQILKNLLSNAVKFTAAGRVSLDIRAVSQGPQGQEGGWVAFSVLDTGIGISADKHTLIFEAFRQADGSISRKYGGTGLGLSISLELAKRLGGHLGVVSGQGEGSAFTLYLPLRA
ncbi:MULTISPECIES: sensor histidine kinase [Paenibacillus]|uniref:sensor histidine kinase n=1 Tax=Paenibacillus TaxID=44249 RepID=UPI0022B891DB|nr:ATP-binding protein [Paenibacillus caseinilyticus]MCZ8523988.1 ATP-binding protein [Paenibacillus caseinilyticus]